MKTNQGIIVERIDEPVQLLVEKLLGQLVMPLQDEKTDQFLLQESEGEDICVFVTPRSVHIVSELLDDKVMQRVERHGLNSYGRVVSYSLDQNAQRSVWWELEDGCHKSEGLYSIVNGSLSYEGPKAFSFADFFRGSLDETFVSESVINLMEDMNECDLEGLQEMGVMRFISIRKLVLREGEDLNEAMIDSVKATFLSRFDKEKDAFMNPDLMDINATLTRKGVFIPRLDWLFKKHEEWDYDRTVKEIDSLHRKLSGLDPLDIALKKSILISRLGAHLFEERKLELVTLGDESREEVEDELIIDPYPPLQAEPRSAAESQRASAYTLPVEDERIEDAPPPKRTSSPRPVSQRSNHETTYRNNSSGNTASTIFTVLKIILLFGSVAGAIRTCSGSTSNRYEAPKYEQVRYGSKRSLSIKDMRVLHDQSKEERLAAIDRADGRWSYDLGNDVFFKQGTSTRLQFVNDTVKYFADGKDLRVMQMSDPSLQAINEQVMYARHLNFHLYVYDANAHEAAGVVDMKILRGDHFDMLSSMSVSKAKKFMKQRKYTWEYNAESKTFLHKKEGYKLRIGARRMIYDVSGESLDVLMKDLKLEFTGQDTLVHQFNSSELVIVPQK